MSQNPSLVKKLAAEMIGTWMLVFIGTGAAVITLLLAKGQSFTQGFNVGIGALGGLGDWLAIGLAFAFAIAAAIHAFGKVSGCHINPAVTIALWAAKRFPAGEVIPYVVAQLVGAALGSLTLVCVLGIQAAEVGGLGAAAPFPGISDGQALLAEAAGTFILMLTIMGVAVDGRAPSGWAGLIIGLTVAGVITTTGNIAGSSLNPARTFGPYLIDVFFGGPNLWPKFWIYVVGPVIGAGAAAFVYDWAADTGLTAARTKDVAKGA